MRLHAALLLPLVVLACASPEKGSEATTAVAEARLPEVRYYVIADT